MANQYSIVKVDKDTEWKARRIAKELKKGEARIVGTVRHESCDYYIVELLDAHETTHVLCSLRPTWRKRIVIPPYFLRFIQEQEQEQEQQ